MKRRKILRRGAPLLRLLPYLSMVLLLLNSPAIAQDDYYAEDDSTYFWDEGEYDETGDEYYDEEYTEDDTTGYSEEEYYDEEYTDEEYYDEGEEYQEEEGYYEFDETSGEYVEDRGADVISSAELVERAQRMGFSLNISYASPGFVNHGLMTYNSYADYRIGIELPMLMRLFGLQFRLGFEFGTFSFENYLPSGGTYDGNTIVGLLSFPAGPGQVKLGGGKIGDYYGYFAETSYGLALGNILDLRVGVRGTSAAGVIDSNNNEIGTASWLDGVFTIGINF
ncbi:MAG: hypothetical protein ABIA75_07270 [Candidatus Neomarinimicrobiota bacterium]